MTRLLCYYICRYFYESMRLDVGEGENLNKWGRAFIFCRPWLADKASQIAHTVLPQQNKTPAILNKRVAQRSAAEACVEV